MAVVVGIFLVPGLILIGYFLQKDEPPAQRAYVECRPFTAPKSVAGINKFIRSQRAAEGFAGGDVGASTRLVDGRTFWVFGDTLRPTDDGGTTMVRNSVLLMGDGCAGVYRPVGGLAAVPDREDGVGYWPSTVDSGPDGKGGTRVVVGLMRIKAKGTGQWDYDIVGSSAARFDVPANDTPKLVGVTDIGNDNPDMSRPLWAAAATLTKDGTVYLYGTAHPTGEWIFGYSLHVARTTVAGLTRQDTWEYWDGQDWNADPRSVATLIEADNGVSRALSVFEKNGSWYAVSKQADFVGSDLVIWKAPSPTGPFVNTGSVAKLPSDEKRVTYMALAHPELLPAKDELVVSWSVNSTDPDVIERNPTLYRPEFARVPLP